VQPPAPVVVPNAPSSVVATALSSSTITLTWDAEVGADSYDVYRNTTNNSGTATIVANDTITQTLIDIGLNSSTAYYYWVKSANAAGDSVFSSVATATTLTPGTIELVNIETLRNAGWDVPDPTEWWVPHPTAAEVKAALRTPFLNDPGGAGICTKRIFLPHTLVAGQFDTVQMNAVKGTLNSMHRRALNAWYEKDINANNTNYASSMAQAITAFNTQLDSKLASPHADYRFTSYVAISARMRDELTALCALDWITWPDAAQFESAFDRLKTSIGRQIASEELGGRNFRKTTTDGEAYQNTSPMGQNAFHLETFLALTVYGVNPSGSSHAWADSVIDRMYLNPITDPTATWNPFHMHNLLGMNSLNGGGRTWGSYASGPGIGGYEGELVYAAAFMIPALDTATNSAWNMVDKNLYIQTRHRGLVVEEDKTVRKTLQSPGGHGCVALFANLLGNTPAGQAYAWMGTRQGESGNMRELRALAGAKPTAVGATGEFAERVGERWCYRENMANPDSTFRVDVSYKSIDFGRESGDERVLGFCLGNIGLVIGHCNRCHPNGVVSNGVWVGEKAVSGDPIFAIKGWWALGCTRLGIFSKRVSFPEEPATDPYYVCGDQSLPVLTGNTYDWEIDWSERAGINNGNGAQPDPRVTGAVSNYSLNRSTRKLVIEDTMTVDLSDGLYLGWHFSPSVAPTLITNGFEFTDGINLIRVTVEPLGSFGLTRTVRTGATAFNLGSYSLPLEWHQTSEGGNVVRIAANVGFTPDTITVNNEYPVRVTIEANP